MQTPSYVILTGASSGIGLATLHLLLSEGYRIIATARNIDAPIVTHANLKWIALDLASSESRAKFVGEITRQQLEISGLINNAGYGFVSPFEGATEDEMRHQMEANFFGTTLLTQAILPRLIARGNGDIITVTSIGGIMAFPFYGYYHASKHALEWTFESLSFELENTGVRVRIVEPGFTRTDFVNRSAKIGSIPVPRLKKPLDALQERLATSKAGSEPKVIAELILKALKYQGRRLRFTGGYLSYLLLLRRFLPESLFAMLVRSTLKG
jgi:short-subunit dehydrogenase